MFGDFGGIDRIEKPVHGDFTFLRPAAVGFTACGVVLEFRIEYQTALFKVAVDHLAGFEPALADDFGGFEVKHSGFGGEHENAVFRQGVTGGAESVAVEDCAGIHTVGERDGGGAVPRFHQGGVIIEKSADVASEMIVLSPCLRDQHQHGVRQAASGGDEELEHIVETCRVALPRVNQREKLLHIIAEFFAFEERFPAAELVEIPAQGIDFAVVRKIAERMRKLPCGEGVGAVTLVNQRERAFKVRIVEIWIESVDLGRKEESLVYDAPAGTARNIAVRQAFFNEAAHNEQFALEDSLRLEFFAADEDLADQGTGLARRRADAFGMNRNVAPEKDASPFGGDDAFDPRLLVSAAEQHCHAVGALCRKCDRQGFAEEFVGQGKQDARAVPGFRITARRSSVHESFQNRDSHFDDSVFCNVIEIRDKPDAAGIVFIAERV